MISSPQIGLIERRPVDAFRAEELARLGVRYLIRTIDNTFGLSASSLKETELMALELWGIGLFLLYERPDNAPSDYTTRDQGLEDASFALAASRVSGYPPGRPIFFPAQTIHYVAGLVDGLYDQHPVGVIGREEIPHVGENGHSPR